MSGSATETRMARPDAIAIAREFVDLLEGTYDRLVVAGSLRRRLAYAHDIEIVAVPKIATESSGLFEDMPTDVDQLHGRMLGLLDGDVVAKRLDANGAPRWGPTLKFLTFRGARVDLFAPDAERFGWILALRTGPAAFSRQLVVPKRHDDGRPGRTKDGRPGLLPAHAKPFGGWLTSRTSGERIPTPEEADVFELFRLPYREPWERA